MPYKNSKALLWFNDKNNQQSDLFSDTTIRNNNLWLVYSMGLLHLGELTFLANCKLRQMATQNQFFHMFTYLKQRCNLKWFLTQLDLIMMGNYFQSKIGITLPILRRMKVYHLISWSSRFWFHNINLCWFRPYGRHHYSAFTYKLLCLSQQQTEVVVELYSIRYYSTKIQMNRK